MEKVTASFLILSKKMRYNWITWIGRFIILFTRFTTKLFIDFSSNLSKFYVTSEIIP